MHLKNISLPASSVWAHDYAFNLHKQRLKLIKLTPSNRVDNSEPATKRFMTCKHRGQAFFESEINKTIQIDNQKLLGKLTWISNRKRALSMTFRESTSPPRSLNFVSRKREAERILLENHSFMRRLSEKPSSVSLNKFRYEYERNMKYKANASKMKFNVLGNKIGKKANLLPPLTEQPRKLRSISLKRESKTDRSNLSMTDRRTKDVSKGSISPKETAIKPENYMQKVIKEKKSEIKIDENKQENKQENAGMFLTEITPMHKEEIKPIEIFDEKYNKPIINVEEKQKNPQENHTDVIEDKENFETIQEPKEETKENLEINQELKQETKENLEINLEETSPEEIQENNEEVFAEENNPEIVNEEPPMTKKEKTPIANEYAEVSSESSGLNKQEENLPASIEEEIAS
ncbi:unnamed protein product [Blepharisma stoltei]|uniref:Protein TIC 214 n=1 Tax=Blepharisma stoltei TaxID=1481888 RepID=A0AAU9IIM1_9CILI|nr:unnamed protein product [Blepharisma stoltei]